MFDRFRFVILAVGLLCLISLFCNYNIINFTFICMTSDQEDIVDMGNGTFRQRFAYTPAEKSSIIWAVAVGTILGTFPINWAYVRWGAKYPFFAAGMLSALSTALIPTAAHANLHFLLACRLLQGIAYAADFAAIGIIVVRWAPLHQTAIFMSFLTCFSPIGSIITNPIAGAFCTSSLGWPFAFYAFSATTVVVFLAWLLIYHDHPELHRAVSAKEIKEIHRDKTPEHIKGENFLPYWEICKSPVILVVWLNAFTEIIGYLIIVTYGPSYINNILKYSVKETAYLSAIGSAVHFLFKILSGYMSDKMGCGTEYLKMCIFNTMAVGVAGVLCALVGVMPTALLAIITMTCSTSISGMNCGGFYKCGTLHSRQYGHFVLAMIQFSKCIALIAGPLQVFLFTKDDFDHRGWQTIFFINGGVQIIANFLFYFTATDKPAEFTKITKATRQREKEQKEVEATTSL